MATYSNVECYQWSNCPLDTPLRFSSFYSSVTIRRFCALKCGHVRILPYLPRTREKRKDPSDGVKSLGSETLFRTLSRRTLWRYIAQRSIAWSVQNLHSWSRSRQTSGCVRRVTSLATVCTRSTNSMLLLRWSVLARSNLASRKVCIGHEHGLLVFALAQQRSSGIGRKHD